MRIEKASIMEKLMDSVSHIVTNTEYRSKCIRTRTQMSDLTQKLHGVSLFLQRISSWISRTEDLNLGSLYLHALPLALGLCQDTVYADTSSRGNRFQELITQFIYIHNDLNIINCRRAEKRSFRYYRERERMGSHPPW